MLFFKIEKKVLIFGRKPLILTTFELNLLIQNIVLGVSRKQNCKMFPCGISFSGVLDEVFIKVP